MTFLSWRYQCLGGLALRPCRCMNHMIQFSLIFSWRRPSLGSLLLSFLRMVSLPFLSVVGLFVSLSELSLWQFRGQLECENGLGIQPIKHFLAKYVGVDGGVVTGSCAWLLLLGVAVAPPCLSVEMRKIQGKRGPPPAHSLTQAPKKAISISQGPPRC